MSTDLDAAIAAEEHRQGKPYMADPEHCQRCAEVDWAWAEATGDTGTMIRRLLDRRGEIADELVLLEDTGSLTEREFNRLRGEIQHLDARLEALSRLAEIRL